MTLHNRINRCSGRQRLRRIDPTHQILLKVATPFQLIDPTAQSLEHEIFDYHARIHIDVCHVAVLPNTREKQLER